MATIAVGDIHGNLPALQDLLAQVRDSVSSNDTVVFLGDYIDRGPDSQECIEQILQFRSDGRAEVVCLRGNHEDWLLRTKHDYSRHSWLLGMEGLSTVRSYSPEAADALKEALSAAGLALFTERHRLPYDAFFDRVPARHLAFLESLTVCYRGSDGLCVHGGLDPGVARLEEQTEHALIWGAGDFPNQYSGAEPVAYGHWNNAELDSDGWPHPRVVGATIGLDTIAHGVLTAIRLEDRQRFQSARHRVSVGGP